MNKKECFMICPTGQLPHVLSRIRRRYLDDAKSLNGNCCCLMPLGVTEVRFRYDGVMYAIRRESFGMDWDAFNCSLEDIEEELINVGCEMLDHVEEKI